MVARSSFFTRPWGERVWPARVGESLASAGAWGGAQSPRLTCGLGKGGCQKAGARIEELFWEEGAGNKAKGALAHLLSSHELSFAQAETVTDLPTLRASYKDERRDDSNLSFNRGRHEDSG